MYREKTIGYHVYLEIQGFLRSFPCFAVRNFSVHEGKIVIFERFYCSFTNIIQLN